MPHTWMFQKRSNGCWPLDEANRHQYGARKDRPYETLQSIHTVEELWNLVYIPACCSVPITRASCVAVMTRPIIWHAVHRRYNVVREKWIHSKAWIHRLVSNV